LRTHGRARRRWRDITPENLVGIIVWIVLGAVAGVIAE